jgi:endonuclease III
MKLMKDFNRARLVILRIQKAFTYKEGLLAEVDDLVENQIPVGVKTLSREHALFLFYIIVNDHGMKSSRLYARAKELFQVRPELFEATKILEMYHEPYDSDLVEATGRYLGTRYPRETARAWYLNSLRLENLFSGDPRKLFCCCIDAQKLLDEITAFRGYGPKTGGMFLRAIVGLGFVKLKGLENVLVPVDIHDTRISFFTGIVNIDNNEGSQNINYYSYVRDIQRILRDTCRALSLPWLDIDRALWLIGSRGCARKRCLLCPLRDLCRVGKALDIKY